jgi:Sec-independent protein translocase protein TatA
MPTILFILLLALVIFGPRKLLHVATNMASAQHPWQKLISLITASGSTRTDEPGSLRECAESQKQDRASVKPLSPLTADSDVE